MNTLQFPENSPQNQHDLGSKGALLRRFTAQIAPAIHDQSDLLCSALTPIIIHQMLVSLYMTHLEIKTSEALDANPQLDYIFHGFTPADASMAPLSLMELVNLIQTGDKDTKAPDDAPGLLPAPLKDLPVAENTLIDLFVDQILYLLVSLTHTLSIKTDETPIDDQVTRLLRRTVESLTTLLPSEESNETAEPADAPGSPGVSTESAESNETSGEHVPTAS